MRHITQQTPEIAGTACAARFPSFRFKSITRYAPFNGRIAFKKHALLLVALLTQCWHAHANNGAQDRAFALYDNQRSSLSIAIGKMDVDASEYVFIPEYNHTLSRIDWKTQSLNVLKIDMNYAVSDRVMLGLRGWTSLVRGNAVMDDYDWEAFGRPKWTRWSHHPTSRQQFANNVDASATFWFLQRPAFSIGGVVGYEISKYSWISYGGHFIYEVLFAPPDTYNIFDMPDSVAAIGHKQTLKTPYLGIATQLRYGKWSADILAKYSRWTKVHADDEHYQRPFYSRSSQKGGAYHALTINLGYHFTDNTSVFVQGSYSHHRLSTGDNLMSYYKAGTSTYTDKQEIGSSNRSRMFAIGLRHAF